MTKDMLVRDEKTLKLVGYVKQRIRKNKNFLCAFTGPTGSGKSYSAMRFGELLGEELGTSFNVDHVTFTPKEFMKMINNDKMKKGSVLILDEAGVAVNSRDWQSKINQMINYVMQTFRHKNYVVILCVPDFGFIDSAIRKMFHCLIETVQINYKQKTCWTKPLMIQVNQRTGDAYYKYLRFKQPGKNWTKLTRQGFKLPDKDLRKAYEKKKTEFTTKLNKDIEKILESEDMVGLSKKALTEQQQEFLDLYHEGHTQREISEMTGSNLSLVNKQLQACEKKGYEVVRGGA